MGYTLEQYNALCAAIAQGVRVVQYADKMVTYNTPEQMQKLKRAMEAALGIDPDGNNDGRTPYRRNVGSYTSGF